MRQFRILAPLLVGLLVSAPAHAAGPDWSEIETAFKAGEAKSGHVFSHEEASRCVGRWRLHADAVDDGAFPPEADALLPRQLRLPDAIGSGDFFLVDPLDEDASRTTADEAERLLRSAFAGDQAAVRQYFENLGLCSTKPEEARDDTVTAVDLSPETPPEEYFESPTAAAATRAFEQLKSREGLWQLGGQPLNGLRIRFYPTAGGSVLVEEWTRQGKPHSLTLYHRDGEDLIATHYCPQGNQPRMVLVRDEAHDIRFTLRDATDLDMETEQHQHDLWFDFNARGFLTRGEIYHAGHEPQEPQELTLEIAAEDAPVHSPDRPEPD